VISDLELIRSTYDGHDSARRYSVAFSDGSRFFFGVETYAIARRYAREYGVRFRNGATVVAMERVE
jgi:hypothetical protein